MISSALSAAARSASIAGMTSSWKACALALSSVMAVTLSVTVLRASAASDISSVYLLSAVSTLVSALVEMPSTAAVLAAALPATSPI